MIRILGQGRSGTVYLALHQELEEYRAIKKVSKTAACHEQFRKEALLLKRLRHPGIPIVYDLEEDTHHSYLIEEFLEGNSFYDLIHERGHLSREAVVMYGIQICDLVHYLHSAEDIPILHLDLQPRNLLVCHGQVKLLDFDHSDTLLGANAASLRYGTPGYCAPEQMEDGKLGIFTDVYQIGAVLYYLAAGQAWAEKGTIPPMDGLGAVIRRCLHHDAALRYGSALEVKEELERLRSRTESVSRLQRPDRSRSMRQVRLQAIRRGWPLSMDRAGLQPAGQSPRTAYSGLQPPPLIIALVGARPGAGVTHIAIGLAAYLDRTGHLALYEEKNRSNDVRAMAESLGSDADSYGICRIFKLPMKPLYGEAVRLRQSLYPIVVRDYGTELEAAAEAEAAGELAAVLFVQDGKWWSQRPIPETGGGTARRQAAIRLASADHFCILYNRAVPGAVRQPRNPGQGTVPCLRVPEYGNPFKPNQKAEACFQMIAGRFLPPDECKEKEGKKWRFPFLSRERKGEKEQGRSG